MNLTNTYNEVQGDLLDLFRHGTFDVICHGCNCMGIMGAGIAKQIAIQYPEAYVIDKTFHRKYGAKGLLGSSSFVYIRDTGFIFNLYTQFDMGRNFKLQNLQNSLKDMLGWLGYHRTYHFGFPLIGCGIGGGNWDDVKVVLQEELCRYGNKVTVVHYTHNLLV